jgi:hypothetical protein
MRKIKEKFIMFSDTVQVQPTLHMDPIQFHLNIAITFLDYCFGTFRDFPKVQNFHHLEELVMISMVQH